MPPFFRKIKGVLAMKTNKKETNTTVTYKGEEYALVFNLNVMEIIQEEYNSVGEWASAMESAEPRAKDIKFGFTAMLNEGIDIYNETHEEKRDFLTEKQVGRIISELGLMETAEQIKNTVIESTKSDEKN